MKNLKKVLAMVLAFACTFTMFAGAKVFEDVPAGSDYSEAITMLSDLGVIQGKDDGKYHPEDTITRAEACAMIARLMTGDPNVSQYTGAQNFADVAKGSWKDSAIGYCYINNIVVGVGNNKFEPDRAITDAEFVTMVVRAMGYETPDMTQGYPYSYMSNAQAIGLLNGVNMVASTDALRGEDAQVIYNALFTDYARGAKLVNTTHGTSVETYPTLAESVWGLTKAAVGEWQKNSSDDETAELTNCKAHTWVVIGADPTEENHILAYPIDDDTTDLYNSKESHAYEPISFKYEGDVDSIRGYKVELWGEGSHGEPTWEKGDNKFVFSENWTIKAIKTVKGQTKFDYNPSMADSKADNGTIELEDTSLDLDSVAGNAQNVNVSVGGYRQLFVAKDYNGESKMNTDAKVEAALNVRDGAQYQLMDWDSDGDVDWVVVDEASYFKVESVSSKRLTVSSMKVAGETWEKSKDSVKDTWKLDGLNDIQTGMKIKYEVPDGLEEGDILEVTYTSAYDKSEKAEVVTATVSVVDAESKSLDKVSTKGGLTLTFDDEEIKVAENVEPNDVIVPANPATYRDFNSEELGTDFDLYLNRNGFIVYSDYTTDRASYAMVLDTKNGGDVLANRGLAKVDLLTADNKHLKGVELTATATINGTSNDRKLNDGAMVGQVYKYWTNDNGQITKMTSVITPADMAATKIDASDYRYDADADRLVDAQKQYVASLEDANVIFAVKPNSGSAATNGANFSTVNAGYIQVADTDGDGVGENFYVDADDVLAVKQSDIPDIQLSTGTDANVTNANKLDNKTTAATTRAQTWLGANNAGNDYTNTFVAEIDSNGKASAAILGVENFNKFGAGSTKIALVTDVTYANSTDGKYVELTGAFGGENKTITSTKKVAFGDIVKAYDVNTKSDVTVDNPSAKAAGTLFANVELDKYLEDGAAYAEVTTDGDGNLTKVTFLDSDGYNNLAGHYYNVSRNITLGATNKSINYMFNDGSTKSVGSNVYIAKQYYAGSGDLYSVPENLAKTNEAFTDDATFYSIDGAATRGDKNYTGTELTVVDGFQRTPKITAGEDYTVVEASSIDNLSDKDSYEVADIARKNNGDVAAVYAFNDSFDEVKATDVAIVGLTDHTTGKPITSAKAGSAIVDLTAVVVDSNAAKTLTGVQILDANGNDVTSAWAVTGGSLDANNKIYTKNSITIPASANGKYTIYAVNGTTKYTIGALELTVTDGVIVTYKVTGIDFMYNDSTDGTWKSGLQVDAAAQNTFYVGVSGTTNGTMPLAGTAVNNPVSGLTAANFEVQYKGIPSEIYSVTEVANEPGLYKFVMKNDLPENQNVTVNVKATGIVNAVDTAMQNGITSVVTTSGATTEGLTSPSATEIARAFAKADEVTVAGDVPTGTTVPDGKTLILKDANIGSSGVTLTAGSSKTGVVKLDGITALEGNLTLTDLTLDATKGIPQTVGSGTLSATTVKAGNIADDTDLTTLMGYVATSGKLIAGDITASKGVSLADDKKLEAASVSGKLTVNNVSAKATVTGAVNEIDVQDGEATVGSVTKWDTAAVASGKTLNVTEDATEDVTLDSTVAGTVAFKKDVAALTVNSDDATVTVAGNATGKLTVTKATSVEVTGSVDTVELAATKAATVGSVTKWDAATVPSDATLTVKGDVADAITMGAGVAGTVKFDGKVAGLTFGAAAKVEFAQAVDMTTVDAATFTGATVKLSAEPSKIATVDAEGSVLGLMLNATSGASGQIVTQASDVKISGETYTYTAGKTSVGGYSVQADYVWYYTT